MTVCSKQFSNSNSGACGTHNYASPEQLSDSTLKTIDYKSDIYSLGIVFLQLIHDMNTVMEINRTLKDCKKLILPKEFMLKHPSITELLLKTLSNDPHNRPTISVIFIILGIQRVIRKNKNSLPSR